jgi:cobalt/nickel transport system permease protein
MVGQLLLRSLDRSDRVYNAMLSRGYDGRLLTLNPHQMKRHDWLWGASGVVLIGLIQVIGRVF